MEDYVFCFLFACIKIDVKKYLATKVVWYHTVLPINLGKEEATVEVNMYAKLATESQRDTKHMNTRFITGFSHRVAFKYMQIYTYIYLYTCIHTSIKEFARNLLSLYSQPRHPQDIFLYKFIVATNVSLKLFIAILALIWWALAVLAVFSKFFYTISSFP